MRVLPRLTEKCPFAILEAKLNKRSQQMTTATYNALTEQQKREVRMYGCTEAQMREAVESSITFKFTGPAMVVASMMSDAQEMMAYEQPDFNVIEDQRMGSVDIKEYPPDLLI